MGHVQRRLSTFQNPRIVGVVGQHAISWMERYFRLNTDVMPTSGKLHLMDNYTRFEVYTLYKDDMLDSCQQFTSYSHFTRLWKNFFNNVKIPRKIRMGVCSVCANLKSKRQNAQCSTERGTLQLLFFLLSFYLVNGFNA